MDLAAEHVDPEDLSVVVALGEGEAVALRCAIVSPHTEQDFVDGVVGNLRTVVGVQQPVEKYSTLILFSQDMHMVKEVHLVHHSSFRVCYTIV